MRRKWVSTVAVTGAGAALALLVSSMGWLGPRAEGASPPGSAMPSDPAPRASAAPAAIAGVQLLPIDTPTVYCLGTVEDRAAVLALAAGTDFWTAFPHQLASPELEAADQPLIAVVYKGVWPGTSSRVPGSSSRTSPAPGTSDVCGEVADGSGALAGNPFIVYGDVSYQASIMETLPADP